MRRRTMPTLDQVMGEIQSLQRSVDNLVKSIDGNGRPGLKDRATILEQAVIKLTEDHAACPAREAYTGGAKRGANANVIAIAAVAISLIAVIAQVWS